MECKHDNCLTCPYPDCISDKGPVNRVKKKPGRKKLDPEEKRQRAKEQRKEYYERNKEKRLAYAREYSRSHAAELRRRSKENRDKRQVGIPTKTGTFWITDGKNNKRIHESNFISYAEKGWYRGRTIDPYKYTEED